MIYYTDLVSYVTQKPIRTVTFQITNDCCCNCSYCYQINKGHDYMSKETALKCINLIFSMYEENNQNNIINKNIGGIIFEFIGGEPLMNIPLMDYITTEIIDRCINNYSELIGHITFLITTNGAYYFNNNFQQYLDKFGKLLDIGVTLDGPKEVHDKCRVYYNNKGNFDDAYAAYQDIYKRSYGIKTKITIVQENLPYLDDIIKFFYKEKANMIFASLANEPQWTIQDAKLYYNKLKEIANYILDNNLSYQTISLFEKSFGHALPNTENECWCGSSSSMLAFAPNGDIYTCIRFIETSLNNEIEPMIIGNCEHGIGYTEKEKYNYQSLKNLNRRTQQDDECYSCPINSHCPSCSAWNYQENKNLYSKSKRICPMIKAQTLANCYFWNKLYKKENKNERFILNLSKEESLKYISLAEYEMLIELEKG